MLNPHLTIPYAEIAAFCERHHIRKLSLFGSVLREDFRPEGDDPSDVDVLVEFEPDVRVTLMDIEGMQIEFADLLGREVDLRTPEELHRSFRQQVIDTAIRVYER